MTVSELLNRISSRELSEWMAFYNEEPWGTEIDLYGHAMTTSTLLNIYRKSGTPPVSPNDVMPIPRNKPSVNDMIAQAKAIKDIYEVLDVDDN